MNWLDKETKAILKHTPDDKLAPPRTAEFALVLLDLSDDLARLNRAVCRVNDSSTDEALRILDNQAPIMVNADLSYEDALLGQFELISCDAISILLRAEVAADAGSEYLTGLIQQVKKSPEFEPMRVRVDHIPDSTSAERFVDQFIRIQDDSQRPITLPFEAVVPSKKARIMKHWAARIDIELEVTGGQHAP